MVKFQLTILSRELQEMLRLEKVITTVRGAEGGGDPGRDSSNTSILFLCAPPPCPQYPAWVLNFLISDSKSYPENYVLVRDIKTCSHARQAVLLEKRHEKAVSYRHRLTCWTLFHVPLHPFCSLWSLLYSVQCSLHPSLFPGDLTGLIPCSLASFLVPLVLPLLCSVFPASFTVPWRPCWTLFHVPLHPFCSLWSFLYSAQCSLQPSLFPGDRTGLCSMFPCTLSVPFDPSFTLFSVPCICHCSLATLLDSVPYSLASFLFPLILPLLCSVFLAFFHKPIFKLVRTRVPQIAQEPFKIQKKWNMSQNSALIGYPKCFLKNSKIVSF